MAKQITIFTPTYNRAYCLHQVYESLLRQTNKGFIWLVIDDGSTDKTRELVSYWVAENKIELKYIYQENQGMHGAHNTAYQNITTILNVCIDSDDFMPDDAIEVILNNWQEKKDYKGISGLVGLDSYKNGEIIGSKFPKDLKESSLSDVYGKWNVKGDKKLVLLTEVVKKYPQYPIFKGERFVPLGVLYLMIDQDYKLACINKTLCIVEYLEDGSSLNIFKQYKNNPKGFRYSRIIELKYIRESKRKFVKILHLISSTLFIGDFKFFKNNPQKVYTFICLPIGFLFHLYVILKISK